MKEINFWETNYFKKNFKVITKDELKKLLKNKYYHVMVLDNYIPTKTLNEPNIYPTLESKVKQLKLILNYTDINHQIIKNDEFIIINKNYFQKNKDEILKVYYLSLENLSRQYIKIEKELFDNTRFSKLIKNNPNLYYNVSATNISEENKQYLKDNYIFCINEDKKYSDIVISNYKLSDLYKNRIVKLNSKDILNISKSVPNNIIYTLNDSHDFSKNMYDYSNLISILEGKKIKSTVLLDFDLLENMILNIEFIDLKYVNILVLFDNHIYSMKQFLLKEKQLELSVKKILKTSLSVFEKYMQTFKIINQYSNYKDKGKNFTNILRILLLKIGINSYVVKKDRLLVNIKDPKYDINGYYFVNTSYSSFVFDEFYSLSILTAAQAKIDSIIGKIFNVKTMEDFSKQINIIIDNIIQEKKQLFLTNLNLSFKNEKGIHKKDRLEKYFEKEAIIDIYNIMMNIFRKLDNEKYKEFVKKYNYFTEIETDLNCYYDFLSDLGKHIIKHTNSPIYFEHMMVASVCMKMNNTSKEKREQIKNIIKDYEK